MYLRAPLLLPICLLSSQLAFAERSIITISDEAQYQDKETIAKNILRECTELGNQFSNSTEKFLSKRGWSVNRTKELSGRDKELKLIIIDAVSGGNIWQTHVTHVVDDERVIPVGTKVVSIKVELYDNGQLVDTYEGERMSSGGLFGGVKSACSVLHRCVKTLGKDVSKWMKSKKH